MRNLDENIDAYLKGQLTGGEKAALEKEIAGDPELKKAVLRQKAYNEAIDLLVAESLKKRFLKKPSGLRRIYQPLAAAASVLILVFVGSYWWASTQLSDEHILQQSYLTANLSIVRRGIDTSQFSPALLGAMQAFVNEEPTEAIRQFEALLTDSVYSVDAEYFLGHLYFQQGNYQQAAQYFNALQSHQALPAYISAERVRADYLLSRFGAGNMPTDSLQQLYQLLERIEPEKATTLRRRLHHPLGRFFY